MQSFPFRSEALLILCLCTAGRLVAAPRCGGHLGNDDTAIVVVPGAEAPRLASLSLRGTHDWINRADETLPSQVSIEGKQFPLTWRLDSGACRTSPTDIELVYRTDTPRLELTWGWRSRSRHGPLEHTVEIRSEGGPEIWLPWQPGLRFDWQTEAAQPLERLWVEKGADAPSDRGTHLDALRPGDSWYGISSTYARPLAGEPREMIPFLLVDTPDAEGLGWYIGIEFSGRTRMTLARDPDGVRGTAGLNPEPGPYRTRLSPGSTYATPTVFLGAFRGGADAAGNELRRWVRKVLGHPEALRNPSYPLLVNNSWGSGMAVDEALARRMILESHQLGLEMFHLDAGWFRSVGDWHADPVKFPHGVAAVADFAHHNGLRFGLWIDWTQAGLSKEPGARNVEDEPTRDWLVADPPAGWKHTEEFKGITMDIGVPAAREWTYGELERVVTENHLDMLEHDGYLVAQGSARDNHPAAPPDPGTLHVYEDSGYLWADGSNSTDVSDHATRAYYDIYERLRARHPALMLELCNDGGRMMDFGSAAHGDYFSVTDIYDPLSNRRAFFDASHVFPPAMLESYVEKWPAPSLDNFRYMLRSGMMGWFSLMLDTSQWSAQQHAAAIAEFALYKQSLRPLIREADLYHVSPRPDGVHWDGIEYYSPRSGRGVLYAFRGSAEDEPSHRYLLQGLDPRRRYRVSYRDHDERHARIVPGEILMRDGVEVALAEPLTSDLVFIRAL